MKIKSHISTKLRDSNRSTFNPVKSLCPESLSHMLDAFEAGYIQHAALTWEHIERRDDLIKTVADKRKKSVARLDWEILTIDNSPEAKRHQEALLFFYNNLSATHATDLNQSGGLPLLIKQMMDSAGKKYAVHEIVFNPKNNKQLTATFYFVPLWFFENTQGQLKFLQNTNQTTGVPLKKGEWLISTGDCLMEASSIAYLFKHLPLRDWLIYCERNGMPGLKATTPAQPGSKEWDLAQRAIEDFGTEFNALMSDGCNIEAIDLTSRSELPYPKIIERMDRAICALWRGSDLSTLSANTTGASLQKDETQIIQEDDAARISETLNTQVDRFVLNHLFGVSQGKAYIKLLPKDHSDKIKELEIIERLTNLGIDVPKSYLHEKFNIPST